MNLTHVRKTCPRELVDVQKALMLNNQRFIFRSGKEGFPILVKSSEVRGVRRAAMRLPLCLMWVVWKCCC